MCDVHVHVYQLGACTSSKPINLPWKRSYLNLDTLFMDCRAALIWLTFGTQLCEDQFVIGLRQPLVTKMHRLSSPGQLRTDSQARL